MTRAGMRALLLCAVALVLAPRQASAHPGDPAAEPAVPQATPKGPADVIGGAGRARAERDLQQAAARAAQPASAPATDPQAPAAAPSPAADPHTAARSPHAGMAGDDAAQPPPIASAEVDTSLPAGTIRVRVREQNGAPAANAAVSLGIMSADSSRSSKDGRTDAQGVATFSDLVTGDRQAYRVNVPYKGAKYSSTPFRLPPRGGYDVQVRRLETTHDDKLVVLYVGATSVELKDDRVHVVQQVRLFNLGGTTYVFPAKGSLVGLPQGFMAVQVDDVMTDQRVAEAKGEGLRVTGSLPPGEATLLWGFDLPLSGTESSFVIDIPWVTFAYRVIADAPEGLSLEVKGMPEPLRHEDGGRRFLITEMQRQVGDPRFDKLAITLRGIPGPGPGRYIAVALALAVMIFGVVFSRREQPAVARAGALLPDLEAHKQALLANARELQAQRDAGEIGPEYHAEQLGLVTDELAALLFEEEARSRKAAPA